MNNYLDDKQQVAVNALFELKRICDKHGIRFYLLAGTALGAVRHGGMIPWDDDIDVGLMYEDLKKLKEVISYELDSRFEFADPETEPAFPRLFGKILYNRCSCVDLFLLAKWTDNNLMAKLHWHITRFCVESYYLSLGYEKMQVEKETDTADSRNTFNIKTFIKRNKKKLIKKIRKTVYKLCFFWDTNDYIKIARWNETFFENRGYTCYTNLYSIYGEKKERLRREWVENTTEVIFEGEKFTTMGNVDAYLTHLYGDYMKLPPEEKRIRNRHAEIYPETACDL